jgi:hypothetical protein
MGCDIHAYVEYVDFVGNDGEPYWSCLMQNIGHRDYAFFSLIADCGRGPHQPVFENRGLPDGKLSWITERAMWLTVTDNPELADAEGYCNETNALSWGPIEQHGDFRRVMHPDLHSHTWLTCDELAQVIARYMTDDHEGYPYGVEWDAALAAMRALEERGHKTRIVIAFDN